ncbi:hypothetical protein DPMN_070344 [Dreissena polymorpha]|uniref:Uncharacterized protein n=1 Tax=Dreissena polymorpha TaxID=45954 RepID=A0A9D3Z605_DREPO|nr:hypothetical protein DPMN_070344 [Dreissena polymorpha]
MTEKHQNGNGMRGRMTEGHRIVIWETKSMTEGHLIVILEEVKKGMRREKGDILTGIETTGIKKETEGVTLKISWPHDPQQEAMWGTDVSDSLLSTIFRLTGVETVCHQQLLCWM